LIVAVNLFKVWLLRERLGFLFDEPDKLRLALRRSGSRENQGNAHHVMTSRLISTHVRFLLFYVNAKEFNKCVHLQIKEKENMC